MVILRLFIPEETVAQSEALEHIRRETLLLAGGYTELQAVGVWQGQAERVKVLEVWIEEAYVTTLLQDCTRYLTNAGEHSMGYTLNGQPVIRQLGEVG